LKRRFSILLDTHCSPGFSYSTSLVHADNPRGKFPAFVVPFPPWFLPTQTFRERKKRLAVLFSNHESLFHTGHPRPRRINLSGGIKGSDINQEGIGVSSSAFPFLSPPGRPSERRKKWTQNMSSKSFDDSGAPSVIRTPDLRIRRSRRPTFCKNLTP
jgi:hypothetical protein